MSSDKKIQEIQVLEQTLQNLLMQKQAFQMELSETELASKEVENAKGEVFKIIGQLMIKTENKKIKDELSHKERLLNLRLQSMEKQESALTKQLEKLREEVV